MIRVIVVGSPRSNGRSAHLAELLFEASIDECPEDEVYLVPVSELEINPCIACGACRKEREYEFETEDGETQRASGHFCVLDDDMVEVYPLLKAADELVIVSPIFFSGAPAPFKAFLDRMQPYFWEYRTENGSARNPVKRPMTLHVIGEGGDPHGYAPLVSEVRSAMASAGFKLERLLDWVGKIDQNGEIIAEAEVVEGAELKQQTEKGKAQNQPKEAPAERPKLDLSAGKQSRQSSDNNRKTAQQGKRSSSKQGERKNTQQTKQQGKGKRRG